MADQIAADQQLAQNVAERDRDYHEALINAPHRAKALIQDGQALARDLYRIAEMMRDGNWTLLRRQADHYAIRLDEAGNALREFGA